MSILRIHFLFFMWKLLFVVFLILFLLCILILATLILHWCIWILSLLFRTIILYNFIDCMLLMDLVLELILLNVVHLLGITVFRDKFGLELVFNITLFILLLLKNIILLEHLIYFILLIYVYLVIIFIRLFSIIILVL